ncbi:chitinase [Pseudonocardiaceae bacterium YIM PH 21723]|nr:chitinase [Pseudonocardiaceae bacterium YIM PH 21723]
MRKLRYALAAAALAGATVITTQQIQLSPVAQTAVDPALNSPYLYDWENKQDPVKVMAATGIKSFTLAFITDKPNGQCTPGWDNTGDLTRDVAKIAAIRAAGGDVTVSIGGATGPNIQKNKLGVNCADANALAAAYQKVIDTLKVTAIDIDAENEEYKDLAVIDKITKALKIVKDDNPGLKTVITVPTTKNGPIAGGTEFIKKAKSNNSNIDLITVMPFDFYDGTSDIPAATRTAVDGLKKQVQDTFGLTDAEAYKRVGFSGMNGKDDEGKITDLNGWNQILAYATEKHVGRVSFWSVNRDYTSGSGVPQTDLAFTKALAGFTG